MGAPSYQLYRIGRRVSRNPIVRRLLPERLRARVQGRLLNGAIQHLPDRRYMEEVLIPAMVALRPGRLLDVGIEHYSGHYRQAFPADCEYWTLDCNPAVAGLGAPGRHIVGDALELGAHFPPGSLDLVLLNGTFGFGIDRAEDQERAVAAVQTVLRPGGRLLVGWDRAADGSPLVMGERPAGTPLKDPLELAAIREAFDHGAPGALPPRVKFGDCSHVYDWFERR